MYMFPSMFLVDEENHALPKPEKIKLNSFRIRSNQDFAKKFIIALLKI